MLWTILFPCFIWSQELSPKEENSFRSSFPECSENRSVFKNFANEIPRTSILYNTYKTGTSAD